MGRTEPLIVKYKNKWYDLTEFAHKHPGGKNSLTGLHNKDMEERFDRAPGHSQAAQYLMKEYQVKPSAESAGPDAKQQPNGYTLNGAKATVNGTTVTNGYKNGVKPPTSNGLHGKQASTVGNGEVTHLTDDSMEHLVDWSKPMVFQIHKLGDKYGEWVNKPVDRELRLFGPSWVENMTKTPWWIVPGFWIPAILYIIVQFGARDLAAGRGWTDPNQSFLTVDLYLHLVIGAFAWTLLEYSLHRWVFHLDPKSNRFLQTFHFLIHGQHHKVPFDPHRLVFPVPPAILLTTIFYQPVYYVFPYPRLTLAGGLIGYLIYDMIHYYLHYGSPAGGHLYHMKRYHYSHHFVHHDQGYGISSDLWDKLFGTRIILRKLKYLLKW
ncbi:dihydroceramide fatty acyl 2-hydroxylase FAH2 [Anopheles stephensi]|uniref:dihydroceramide fatty acyl 2-hydroxylase FAH2 n=1 Tax=Anopheles stephensi TaxID=30069 RepID=UPI001658B26D|nr:dihydroceramide fatty acyl 2-hydroxylase FAH2 [Anopheles stephensi]XP_035902663.1 dihydroceramide fatty acyl 2-hydroxylase FAH2 [Anopheles stephensi]XP_035902664.1 dihydroceramide fatty acyl 2-hydroxylase FAH2 [Anopheles stephensi]XP_035902666.1 dihydroceramide fatty acyl 2-hydroxylase FAH2 [Anopheles stephensi]XP_035902667.1 dihydroceramide fatty acyl 2-hydroxylase FAH2 [Anopheles stephensi]XP_035902668.1 dihydroceramide fatty acyl 2-hydroxylase FAH2 [Anopheles stephensi]